MKYAPVPRRPAAAARTAAERRSRPNGAAPGRPRSARRTHPAYTSDKSLPVCSCDRIMATNANAAMNTM